MSPGVQSAQARTRQVFQTFHSVATPDRVSFGLMRALKQEEFASMTSMTGSHYTAPLGQLRMADVERVGGKNASLGEMISQLSGAGIRVPGGFATTAQAYRDFLSQSGLDERIRLALATLDPNDVEALARCGSQIRQWIMDSPFTPALEKDVAGAYHAMMEQEGGEVAVAVRTSATAEDLPDASFAGQQETFLNIRGLDLAT
jgi:pyruvate, water dikinase